MLDKLDVFEARVRERAFRLWEEAGHPENSADAFWHQAREVEMRESGVTEKDLEAAEEQPSLTPDPSKFAEF